MAYLHLLLAADSPAAILIKHGPGLRPGSDFVSCTVGWDRRHDIFEMGQCLRQRIRNPDISPDGQYFSYYVDTENPLKEHSRYSGISRTPWLKALTFWGRNPIQSLFLPDSSPGHPRICTFSRRFKPDRNLIGVEMVPDCPAEWESVRREGPQVIQWLRDGWRTVAPWKQSSSAEAREILGWPGTRGVRRLIFEKILVNGWKLQMSHWHGTLNDPSQGIPFETFALISPQNEIRHRPGWKSADFDRWGNRLVWTADNVLYAAPLTPNGHGERAMLWDARKLKFTAIEAPY